MNGLRNPDRQPCTGIALDPSTGKPTNDAANLLYVQTNFIKAWQHIHDIFVNQGVTNVIWVWDAGATGIYTGPPHQTQYDFYPGDAYVDWVGTDNFAKQYPFTAGDQWGVTYGGPLEATYNTIAARGKPIMIGATGAHNGAGCPKKGITDPGDFAQVEYFGEGLTQLTQGGPAGTTDNINGFADIRGMSYFDSDGSGLEDPENICDWSIPEPITWPDGQMAAFETFIRAGRRCSMKIKHRLIPV